VGWSTIGSAGGEPVPGRGPCPGRGPAAGPPGRLPRRLRGARPRVSVAVGWGSAVHGGSYGGKAVAVALANLAAAAAINVGLFLLVFRVLTPPGRSRPGSWSLGSRGRPCRPSVATWSATTCATPARCMGCSRSSLACCSGYIWARGSPCTRQRSTSWPPAGSGRAACCNHHRPTPTHPPQRLTLPTNSNPDPEEATRADVTAPPTSTPTRRTQRCRCRLPAPARHRPGTLVAGRLPMWRAPVMALECLCGQAACAGVGWGLGSGSGSSGIGRTGVSAPGRLADGWVSWPGWLVGPLSQ
jgi:hypothetical protein